MALHVDIMSALSDHYRSDFGLQAIPALKAVATDLLCYRLTIQEKHEQSLELLNYQEMKLSIAKYLVMTLHSSKTFGVI